MGKRGPKPTPTRTLQLRGSWRADLRAGEVQPIAGVADAPAWLSDAARREWEYHAALLAPHGLLTPHDRNALGMYCQSIAQYMTALETVNTVGMWHESNKTGRTFLHPAVGVMHTAMEAARKWGAAFGLTPSDRVGLKSQPSKGKPEGKERFFG